MIGPGKSHHLHAWIERSLIVKWNWKLTAKAELNCWMSKPSKKMPEKWGQFLSSEHPCEPKILDVSVTWISLELKNRLGKLMVTATLADIRFEFEWKERLTVKICVLYGWRFSNQFGIVSETPGAWTASYSLFAAVPWNETARIFSESIS